jgi:hypothetical protein
MHSRLLLEWAVVWVEEGACLLGEAAHLVDL